MGVDFIVNKAAKSPLIRIDLSRPSGQELLWRILHRKDIGGVHLAPPCGTASRAREIRSPRGPNPKPLRSDRFPDGIPTLKGTDRVRVDKANILYRLSSEIVRYCVLHSISVTVENPARSIFWATVAFTEPLKSIRSQLSSTFFHHCMYGSQRRKYTQLMHNSKCLKACPLNVTTTMPTFRGAFATKGGQPPKRLNISFGPV